ncbi:hypothetical protein APR41_10465 [Salegentibacter salinarum]|uniref:SPW repeat-containing integral membrane domain-containing protein n=1 Tax=Salegentibacter salinarum TaxID=447422 RepID=A0A2N0TN86_9FLAO|nr:SPW repeat protein [Salegentibacter salinarum]PKD16201.1 hypothetical protein APR41_10465 [Salegentibacter salinarum]SKB67998.1 SPW repeat-containing protein [Salegentibacter salinarum]
MIPTKIHGYIDYLVGLFLIIIPFILVINNPTAKWLLIGLGVSTIFYSAITDYEMGLVGIINFKIHLFIDILAGLFLAVAPWLFGFADEIYWPFLIIGIGEILISFITAKKPRYPEKA